MQEGPQGDLAVSLFDQNPAECHQQRMSSCYCLPQLVLSNQGRLVLVPGPAHYIDYRLGDEVDLAIAYNDWKDGYIVQAKTCLTKQTKVTDTSKQGTARNLAVPCLPRIISYEMS